MNIKNILLGGAAVGLFLAPAFAQQSTEVVTVTGIRASLQSAQSIKQNSDQVVDAITAVDIGALPDRSVAEALQRVPGVQITRTDQNRDPVRWAGYGNGVFIRGLSWVSALTNGLSTFGAENGRTLSFADVSSDLMAGVDVYKNPSAKMIEGGVGGTVDLKTRKPFDQDGFLIAGSADFSYGDLNEHIAPSANILVSDRWNTSLGEVGVLLSGDYQDLRAGTNVFSTGVYDGNFCGTSALGYTSRASYSASCPSGQNAVQIPDGDAVSYRHMDWKQPRVALYGAVQWRPSETLEVTATALWSKAEPQSVEHVVTWGLPDDSTSMKGYKFAADGSFVSGAVPDAENIWGGQDTRYGARHHISGQYALDLKYTPTDRLTISANVSYTDSRATMYDMTMYTKQFSNNWYNWGGDSLQLYPNAPVVNVSWNDAVGHPVIGYTGDVAKMADKTQYTWGAAMDHLENNYAHNYTARADLSYQFAGTGIFNTIKSVDMGFRADLRQAVTRQSNWNWVGMNYQTWYIWTGLSTAALKTAAGTLATAGNSTAQNASELYTMPKFFGMNLPAMWFPKSGFMQGGEQNVWNTIGSTGDGWRAANTWVGVWNPLVVGYYGSPYNCDKITAYYCNAIYSNTTPSSTSQSGGVNAPAENTFAGYFQANYAHDTFLGTEVPVDGNIGVRVVATESSSGPGYFLYPSVADCGSGATPLAICTGTDKGAAYTFVGNGGGSMNAKVGPVNHNYVDILPSFNFRAHLSDTLQVRTAFSQQIVRPDFAFTQNYTSLSFSFQDAPNQFAFKTGVQGLTGTGGNPDLKALHANNYDLSIEWFFAPTGNLSFAMFHKDITNYFMTVTVPTAYTRNGVTKTFYVQRYANGSKGKVEGFELAYQQFYDSLPGAWSGVGVQANYTKIYNTGGSNASYNISDPNAVALASNSTLPMEGMSHDSYNVALLYAKYDIDARLAWNWRSGFLMTTSAANLNQPVWQGNYGQLDGSVIYSFLDHYKVGLQVSNLTKQMTTLYVGGASYHPKYEWVDGDRKISLVLRAHW